MKILSMTATFGKLERQTLTLQPGLNVIHAPNEWGKSTWCAFIVAMLYGIDTKERTTLTALAAKERYAPWSGSPMSGRMDILWNGRKITLERSTKGRSIFGVFRAYETDTGLEVAELTAETCGQTLLGVEKSVFTRAGFLRSSDMPVTQDEALRKRLNALVSTGDDSGTAEALAQDLHELRNKIRTNRSNGLLPVAQTQKQALEDTLQELHTLQTRSAEIKQQMRITEQKQQQLQNHRAALQYQETVIHADKLAAARSALENARAKAQALEEGCKALPDQKTIADSRQQLQQLRDSRDALHAQLQLLPQEPRAPQVAEAFRGLTPQQAIDQAQVNAEVYRQDSKKTPLAWIALGLLILGCVGLVIPHLYGKIVGIVLLLGAVMLTVVWRSDAHRAENIRRALQYRYGPIPPEQWVQAAQDYQRDQQAYEAELEAYRRQRQTLETQLTQLQQAIDRQTGGSSLAEAQRKWEEALQQRQQAEDARKEQQRLTELVQALAASYQEVAPPQAPDLLTLTLEQTETALSDCDYQQRQMQRQLGNCQGRMESLGQETILRQKLDAINERIRNLEETYAALTLAQETLNRATAELQRRFAPRISQRAQSLFARLTDGRYDRLSLDADLAVHTAAKEETTLHSALWRSEGTTDQLYLALRLAVAEELTPQTPLVLDDALVRFDDTRAAAAMQILREEAETKQVILFTCQQRETEFIP